jgi:hypothetical protein
MRIRARVYSFILLVDAMFSAGFTVAQTEPVAYVYAGTTRGIFVYHSSATGQLTLVPGSPFTGRGLPVAATRSFLFTLGTDIVHMYALAPDGSIGAQVAEAKTQDHDGAECGTTQQFGVLDHSGAKLYVMLGYSDLNCNALQSYAIDKTHPALSFLGAAVGGSTQYFSLETITANNEFAYGLNNAGESPNPLMYAFRRNSGGALHFFTPQEQTPAAESGYPGWLAEDVFADPTNHLAVLLVPYYEEYGQYGPGQLASYTVDSSGNLTTTNPPGSMPVPQVDLPSVINMSPDGKFLAVGSNGFCPVDCYGPPPGGGLQMFHFNGAAPITPDGAPLTNDPITAIHWDKAGHVYAIGWNHVHVFHVTESDISQAPGSPTLVDLGPDPSYGIQSLVVVAR